MRIDGAPQQVLDHGYVKLITTWGSDEEIIEDARQSTTAQFKGWGPLPCPGCINSETKGTMEVDHAAGWLGDGKGEACRAIVQCAECSGTGNVKGDEGLLARLWRQRHTSPFEGAGAKFEVRAPIFVFREWHRHRTQSFNEMSARYTPLPDVNYVPTIERLMIGSDGTNKQAGTVKDAEALTPEKAQKFLDSLTTTYNETEARYQLALKRGVPKELARIHLPVGRYSQMRASANLLNWLRFLRLRIDPAAQWEIRQYAWVVCEMLQAHFPRTMQLFKAESELLRG